jgi:hypothetical protein
VIVLEPSIPECLAGAKYEKIDNKYVAKARVRLISLLDANRIGTDFSLSDISE